MSRRRVLALSIGAAGLLTVAALVASLGGPVVSAPLVLPPALTGISHGGMHQERSTTAEPFRITRLAQLPG